MIDGIGRASLNRPDRSKYLAPDTRTDSTREHETRKSQGRFAGLLAASVINKKIDFGMSIKEISKKTKISSITLKKIMDGEKDLKMSKFIEIVDRLDIDVIIQIEGRSIKSDHIRRTID